MRSVDPLSGSAPVHFGESIIEKFLTVPAAASDLGAPTTKVRRAVNVSKNITHAHRWEDCSFLSH